MRPKAYVLAALLFTSMAPAHGIQLPAPPPLPHLPAPPPLPAPPVPVVHTSHTRYVKATHHHHHHKRHHHHYAVKHH